MRPRATPRRVVRFARWPICPYRSRTVVARVFYAKCRTRLAEAQDSTAANCHNVGVSMMTSRQSSEVPTPAVLEGVIPSSAVSRVVFSSAPQAFCPRNGFSGCYSAKPFRQCKGTDDCTALIRTLTSGQSHSARIHTPGPVHLDHHLYGPLVERQIVGTRGSIACARFATASRCHL